MGLCLYITGWRPKIRARAFIKDRAGRSRIGVNLNQKVLNPFFTLGFKEEPPNIQRDEDESYKTFINQQL